MKGKADLALRYLECEELFSKSGITRITLIKYLEKWISRRIMGLLPFHALKCWNVKPVQMKR